nr:hypothetical protein [Tanacetum cinerariifolium]
NLCFYYPNPNSFDSPPDSCHPPHLTYETYSYNSYGNDSHFGYDRQPQFPLNYESEQGYIKNYNSYPYDSSIFPQQELCCEVCGVLPEADNVTPNEPVDSLSMRDEHLDTISTTESDKFIKSCVETLIPNPTESEGKNGCDLPACFTTFSNILFDADYEFDSSDDQSISDEDFPKEIFSNPLFEEEIIPMKIDQHHFDAESDLIESMLNHDSSIISSSLKIDSFLDEFAEIVVRQLISSSTGEFVSENSDADIESFSPSPIPDEDSDSRMEEIDLTFTLDDLMPPSIEDDDNDSKRDILILQELPSNYSLSLPESESFYFDIPSFTYPPAKPPDGNTRILNIKMMGDVSNQKVLIFGLTITHVQNQEKSPDLLSHWGLENFQLFAKRSMMIHGKNILDVPLFHFYPP